MKTLLLTLTLLTLTYSVTTEAAPGDVYIYPAKGQAADLQERDRYDCYLWAVRETGFDPAQAESKPPADLIRVPVGKNEKEGAALSGTIIGAIAGAAIGSGDHHAGQGAAIGATMGTIIGATVEQKGQRKAVEEASEKAEDIARQRNEDTDRRANYRRAFSACLEGRGYVVR